MLGSQIAASQGAASAANGCSSVDDNIKVFLRIKPLHVISGDPNELRMAGGQQIVRVLSENSVCITHGQKTDQFTYDHVGDGQLTHQHDVFDAVGRTITDNCLQGYNGTIFVYGQTGSGKTYTMQGPMDAVSGQLDFEQRGLIPRCLEYLFERINNNATATTSNTEYLCRASFCEIYNECLYDLLDPSGGACTLREDLKRGVYVDGVIEESVRTPDDVYRLLEIGAQNRHVASTSMNRESSRSHSIFTLTLQSKVVQGGVSDVRESRFTLVDLAGSERQKMTSTTGQRLKEAANINKSLLALGKVINALVDIANGRQRHIHYRDSKLTFLLRDSLGGNAKTAIIATVDATMNCAGETLSTLRFAQRAKMIKNRAVLNQEFQGNVAELQKEIKRLKHELSSTGTRPSMADAVAPEIAAANESELLIILSKRITTAFKSNEELKGQLAALQEYVQSQHKQIQNDKMVIKFRDSTIKQLRSSSSSKKSAGEDEEPVEPIDEMTQLKEELAGIRDLVDHPPEIARFAAENLQLRDSLKKYDEYVNDFIATEQLKHEHLAIETALCEQINQLTERMKQIQEGAVAPEALAKMHELVKKYHQLKQVKLRTEAEHKATIQSLVEEKARVEQIREEMAEELDAKRQLIATLEVQRAHASQEGDASQQRLAALEEENVKLKITNEQMEKKNRRMSDFHSQNRLQTQQQLNEMSERLCAVSAEKDKSDAQLTKVQAERAEMERFIDELKSDINSIVSQLNAATKQHSERTLSLESKIRDLESELDSAQQQYESARIECEDIQGELDFAREKLADAEARYTAKAEEAGYLETVVQEHTSKNKIQEEELRRLRHLLNNNSNASQQELAQASQTIGNLQSQLDVKESQLTLLEVDLKQAHEAQATLTNDHESTKSAARDLSARFIECQNQLSELKKLLSENESVVDELRQENADLRQSVSAMEGREVSHEEQVELIKARLADETMKRESLEHQKAQLEKRIVDIQQEFGEKLAKLNEMESNRHEVDDDLEDRLKAEMRIKDEAMDVQRRELEQYSVELSRLRSSLAQMAANNGRVMAQLESSQEDNQMLLERVRELESAESSRQAADDTARALRDREKQLAKERARLNALSARLQDAMIVEGQAKTLEQKVEYLVSRNVELEDQNAKLVKHNNFKQKLQYHLQIKEENNALRMENQRLLAELERAERRSKEKDGGQQQPVQLQQPQQIPTIPSRITTRR